MSGRIDQVDKYYKLSDYIDRILSGLYYFSMILTFITFYLDRYPNWLKNILACSFIVMILCYTVLNLLNKFYFSPHADNKRRQQLLSNSFEVALITEKTNLYYNNKLPASIKKLGANILENTLFTMRISSKMLWDNSVVSAIYFSAWVILVIYRGTSLEMILLITQVVFAGGVLEHLLSLIVLRFKTEHIHDELYNIFLLKNNDSLLIESRIINCFSTYEATKSLCSVKLSSRIFKRINPQVSQEWDAIKEILNLDKYRTD